MIIQNVSGLHWDYKKSCSNLEGQLHQEGHVNVQNIKKH